MNQVCEVVDKEHGRKVHDYFKDLGYDTRGLICGQCKEELAEFRFYGVIDGIFWFYNIEQVMKSNAKIIEI